MSVILVLIPLSIVCAGGFLAAFIWAVRSGQFEDTCTPSMRLLLDDSMKSPAGPTVSPAGTPVAEPAPTEVLNPAGSETGVPSREDHRRVSNSPEPKSHRS